MSCIHCEKVKSPVELAEYLGPMTPDIEFKLYQSMDPNNTIRVFYNHEHLLLHKGKAYVIVTNVEDLVNFFKL